MDKLQVIHVKVLAGIVGQIVSLQSVLGKIVCRMTRHMHNCILARASWNAPIKVTNDAMLEIDFWLQNVRTLNNS